MIQNTTVSFWFYHTHNIVVLRRNWIGFPCSAFTIFHIFLVHYFQNRFSSKDRGRFKVSSDFFPSGKCFPFSRLPFSCEIFLISPEPTFGFARRYLAKLIWKRKIWNSSKDGEFYKENNRRRHYMWKMRFSRDYHFSRERSTEIFITQ